VKTAPPRGEEGKDARARERPDRRAVRRACAARAMREGARAESDSLFDDALSKSSRHQFTSQRLIDRDRSVERFDATRTRRVRAVTGGDAPARETRGRDVVPVVAMGWSKKKDVVAVDEQPTRDAYGFVVRERSSRASRPRLSSRRLDSFRSLLPSVRARLEPLRFDARRRVALPLASSRSRASRPRPPPPRASIVR
jgi:hypothetical protein